MGSVRSAIHSPLLADESNLLVADLIDALGAWNRERTSFVLPSNILNKIKATLVF